MNLRKKICLLGFMGSGKSTVGSLIAEATGLIFVDMDEVIESLLGMTINHIFKEYGEEGFRRVETSVLKDLLNRDELIVLALGGGTPCSLPNSRLLEPHYCIYLKTPVDELIRRLEYNRQERPLIKDHSTSELRNYISNKMQTRIKYYEKAHVIIENSGPVDDILDQIIESLHSEGLLSNT